ncbi:hypothetical protein CAPTEDRAFT_221031 [Capitella teleta]|uniref:SGNH hydrolase-type esterase domain-containing protein n=1 Tax=Capitella teleta TaxID=283909 RepID=R7V870_CAPTE|nr:hypothetical protein CAPTEDRAFT_221031 [Capitella teleta]|eukprot:ELU15063.1 hypothetical protein CAPTEDRAFT_221031 [Capitella teleta]
MAAKNWPKVVVFGDSISQFGFSDVGGWVSMLANRLQRRCDVINRGLSGYNSRWNRIALPKILSPQDWSDVVTFIIFLGANDSVVEQLNPAQHVPLDEYKDNLISMVASLENDFGLKKKQVVLVGPPACCEQKWGVAARERGVPMSKDNNITALYAKACEEAATLTKVTYVDLYSAMMKTQDFPKYLNDGLHLSQEGALLLDTELWKVLETKVGHLPFVLPEWRDIDPKNPRNSLK